MGLLKSQLIVLVGSSVLFICLTAISFAVQMSMINECARENFDVIRSNMTVDNDYCRSHSCEQSYVAKRLACEVLDIECIWYNSFEVCSKSCDCGWCSLPLNISYGNTTISTQCLSSLFYNLSDPNANCLGNWTRTKDDDFQSSCQKGTRVYAFKDGMVIAGVLVFAIYAYLSIRMCFDYYEEKKTKKLFLEFSLGLKEKLLNE